MTRRLLLTLTLAVTAACAPVAAADAAKPAPYPSVAKVQPLALGIGDTLKITGRNFTAGANKNTVVFKRDGKKAIFAKATTATKTSLSVVVPEKLRAQLRRTGGVPAPTKFRLRVLSRRFAKSYTAMTLSPTIAPERRLAEPTTPTAAELVKREAAAAAAAAATPPAAPTTPPPPPDCDNDGIVDDVDADDDNDLLSDDFEKAIGTDRCKVDTDGDTMDDAWEYKSAFDLNQRSCPDVEYPVPCAAAIPYPGKYGYPNPRNGDDANLDHDGDVMTAIEEYQATKKHGSLDLTSLWYSGGLKASQDEGGDGCRGMIAPEPFDGQAARVEFLHADGTYPDLSQPEYQVYSLDGGDGCLNDGERDEDRDFLRNDVEAHFEMLGPGAFQYTFKEPVYQIKYEGTDWLDQDSDGDTVIDGLDDNDHDDFLNVEEAVDRGWPSRNKKDQDTGDRTGLWTDPFNPCLPSVRSRTCSSAFPEGTQAHRPFVDYDAPPPKPRWPTYGGAFWDVDDPHPTDPTITDTTPPEFWLDPQGLPQDLPPDHPLPRCYGYALPRC